VLRIGFDPDLDTSGFSEVLMSHHSTLDWPLAHADTANDTLTRAGSFGVLAAGLMAILVLML
jgi:hypothetical protein